MNGGERTAVILSNETHITLLVEIVDDLDPENSELFEIRIMADFRIVPDAEPIIILDNDG